MTQQQKLIVIAEACGWKKVGMIFAKLIGSGQWGEEVEIKLNSLDAMQQAVLMQDEEFQSHFDKCLHSKLWTNPNKWSVSDKCFHQLTYTDWQDAFVETLKALGRGKGK